MDVGSHRRRWKILERCWPANNIKFFTYQWPELRPIKILLSGLNDIPCEQLKDHLKAGLNIAWLDIKKISRNEETLNRSVYLLYLERRTKMSALTAHKAIKHALVQWNSNKRRHPTHFLDAKYLGVVPLYSYVTILSRIK